MAFSGSFKVERKIRKCHRKQCLMAMGYCSNV